MYLITVLLALLGMDGSTLTGDAWTHEFLTKLVGTEQMFFNLSWIIPVIVIVIGLIVVGLGLMGKSSELASSGISCMGCALFFLIFWPVLEWISLFLAQGMLANFSATAGVLSPGFWIYLVLYLGFGAG